MTVPGLIPIESGVPGFGMGAACELHNLEQPGNILDRCNAYVGVACVDKIFQLGTDSIIANFSPAGHADGHCAGHVRIRNDCVYGTPEESLYQAEAMRRSRVALDEYYI
jgi:hypothetical protein